VSPTLTRKTFATMRTCLLVRQRWAFGQGLAEYPRYRSEEERAAVLRYYLAGKPIEPWDGVTVAMDSGRAMLETTA
jgi:hypothetical protein